MSRLWSFSGLEDMEISWKTTSEFNIQPCVIPLLLFRCYYATQRASCADMLQNKLNKTLLHYMGTDLYLFYCKQVNQCFKFAKSAPFFKLNGILKKAKLHASLFCLQAFCVRGTEYKEFYACFVLTNDTLFPRVDENLFVAMTKTTSSYFSSSSCYHPLPCASA